MNKSKNEFGGRHFTADVILWAVRWYLQFPISYRDLERMLADRGVSVDHATVSRWTQHYAQGSDLTAHSHMQNAGPICTLKRETVPSFVLMHSLNFAASSKPIKRAKMVRHLWRQRRNPGNGVKIWLRSCCLIQKCRVAAALMC